MKTSKDVLGSALKTVQMGQVGIRCVISRTRDPFLREALRSQLREYDRVESAAEALAFSRGWELQDLDPALKFMARSGTAMRLGRKNPDSKIAAMMIRGNTAGMIKSLKNLHQYSRCDSGVTELAEKLLATEKENIAQMQGFI